MKSFTKALLSFMGLALLLSACASGDDALPDDLLERGTFVAVMIDVQLAEGIKSQFMHSKNQQYDLGKALYHELLERHEVSQADFMRTYNYYQQHPELMETVYEQVLDSLSALEAQIKQEFARNPNAGRDTASVQLRQSTSSNYLETVKSYSVQPADSLQNQPASK